MIPEPRPVVPPPCGESALDPGARRRVCVEEAGHGGAHVGGTGYPGGAPRAVLARLRQAWGHTHRIAWTGTYWVATAHDPRSRWRSHVEPTPAQLEADLRRHTGHPPIPHPRRGTPW